MPFGDRRATAASQTLLIAASQLFFSPPVDIDEPPEPLSPQELAAAIGKDRSLAEHVASLLSVASLADGRVDNERLRPVVEYAHLLPAIIEWHVGTDVSGIGAHRGGPQVGLPLEAAGLTWRSAALASMAPRCSAAAVSTPSNRSASACLKAS